MRNKMLMNHTAADDRERSEGSQQPRHLVPVPPSCFLSHGSLSSVSHGGSLLSHGCYLHDLILIMGPWANHRLTLDLLVRQG